MARSLQFDIVANDKATGKISAVEGALSKFTGNLAKMAGGFFALERVVGAVVGQLQRSFEWGSGMKDAAMAVGLTAEEFQRLEFASKQSGLELGRLQKSFLEIRKLVRDAASGNQQAVATVNALGYSQEQAASGSINYMEAFLRVSEAVTAASTEQEKFNILAGIFGDKIAQDLIPVMSQYAELKRTMSGAPIFTNEEAEVLDRMGDRVDEFGRKIDVLTVKLITFAENPAVQKALQALIPGGMQGAFMTTKFMMTPTETPAADEGPTAAAKTMAAALAEAGKKTANQSNQAASASSLGLPSMASIGGAAGFKGGAGGVPRTETLLEQIEQNTRPAVPVPVNGGTNFTSGNYSAEVVEFNMTAAAVRNTPRRRDSFAR